MPRPDGGGRSNPDRTGKRRSAVLGFLALALTGAAVAGWGLSDGIPLSAPAVLLEMPGDGAFELETSGRHVIYHEDPRYLGRSGTPSGPHLGDLACSLQGPGGPVALVEAPRAYRYSDEASRRAGVSAWTFEAAPGPHVLSCARVEGQGEPVTLAVWTPPLEPFLRSVALFLGSAVGVAGAGLATVTLLRR